MLAWLVSPMQMVEHRRRVRTAYACGETQVRPVPPPLPPPPDTSLLWPVHNYLTHHFQPRSVVHKMLYTVGSFTSFTGGSPHLRHLYVLYVCTHSWVYSRTTTCCGCGGKQAFAIHT